MRPHGTNQQLETRRRRAIAMLKAGKPFRAVAATLSASLSSVVRWNQTHQKHGLRGLQPKPNTGRPCRISKPQKEKLKRILLKGSQAAGYSSDLWTLNRIGDVIHKQFGIRYRTTHVWHLMSAGLQWSWQKPEKRATQRDEEAIARWKKTTWPRIKKSPRA